MSTEHVEVERKYEADETFSLPDLTAVGGAAAVGDPEERVRLARQRVELARDERRGARDRCGRGEQCEKEADEQELSQSGTAYPRPG